MKTSAKILAMVTVATGALIASGTSAAEMKYKAMHQRTDLAWYPVGDVDGHGIGSYARLGTTVLADGEEALHEQIGTYDYTGSNGTYFGYVTHTFSDGSTILEKFEGTAADGTSAGPSMFVKGTGRFEGIAGEGKHTCKTVVSTKTTSLISCDVVIQTSE